MRMVNVVIPQRQRDPSRKDVRDNISFFFEYRMRPYDEWNRVVDWDNTEYDDHGRAFPVCDHISDLSEHFIPNYLSLQSDEMDDEWEAAVERYCDPVSICIRAGLDVAVSPSAGVCGFTVGDIRKMYPRGVPKWVKEVFVEGDLIAYRASNVDGIFIQESGVRDSRTFDELPDDQGVWL